MYRTILVTVDGTPGAQNVVLAAKTCATALGAELIELPIDSSRPADESILAEADARQAHLLVMAAAERLPDHVLAHARMPVMLIRPTDFRMEQLKLILVPTDGSPGSLVALGHAGNLARAARAALVLLRVVRPLPLWIYDPALGINTGPLIDPRWDEDRRIHAEAFVRQVASRVADSGLEVGADALLGEVAPTVAEYADQQSIDLIVMGTHARTGPVKALLGSTAEQVVRTARQPIVLVRRRPDADTQS